MERRGVRIRDSKTLSGPLPQCHVETKPTPGSTKVYPTDSHASGFSPHLDVVPTPEVPTRDWAELHADCLCVHAHSPLKVQNVARFPKDKDVLNTQKRGCAIEEKAQHRAGLGETQQCEAAFCGSHPPPPPPRQLLQSTDRC